MSPAELKSLLARCEDGSASPQDLESLERVLSEQDGSSSFGTLLAQALQSETDSIELGPSAFENPVLNQDPYLPCRDALRSALQEQASKVDLTQEIMAIIEPSRQFDRAMDTLAQGVIAESASVEVAQQTMDRILTHETMAMRASAMLDGELDLAARKQLGNWLGQNPLDRLMLTTWATLNAQLRDALHREIAEQEPFDLSTRVLEALSLQDSAARSALLLRETLSAESSNVDLSDRVMAEILPKPRARPVEAPASGSSSQETLRHAPAGRPLFRRLPTFALLVATGLMVLIFSLDSFRESPGETAAVSAPETAEENFQLFATNETEIQDLTVADDAMVQVFQLDEGAPVVIYIDEPNGLLPSQEEVTL